MHVHELVRVALLGLERMWDPSRRLLLTRDCREGQEKTSAHLSARYCVMTSVGLHRAREAGHEVRLDPAGLLEAGLAAEPPDNLDQLSMGLWAGVELGTPHATSLLEPLLARAADPSVRGGSNGRPLAWALTALSLHHERTGERRSIEAAHDLARFALERCRRPESGLFVQTVDDRPLWPRQALFSTQIYWAFALATYGRVTGRASAVETAAQTVRRLVELRDPLGGWSWRYDPVSGRVPEPFPIYSVHQHGMGPMTLHLLGELGALAVRPWLRESLEWLWKNQLGLSMVDEQRATIWRSVRRRFPVNRVAYTAGRLAPLQALTQRPGFLCLNATCRPYELGWLLYAWAGREKALD